MLNKWRFLRRFVCVARRDVDGGLMLDDLLENFAELFMALDLNGISYEDILAMIDKKIKELENAE